MVQSSSFQWELALLQIFLFLQLSASAKPCIHNIGQDKKSLESEYFPASKETE